MRAPIALLLVAGLFGCGHAPPPAPPAQTAFVPPPPSPPTDRAPICARPDEKQAVAVSALMSELQVISILCHTEDKYNALVPRLRPVLATNIKSLNGFFSRAYGKSAEKRRDDYITELANLQSQLGLKSGDQFCALNAGMLDEVSALPTPNQLVTYASTKPIQQAIAVSDCGTASR